MKGHVIYLPCKVLVKHISVWKKSQTDVVFEYLHLSILSQRVFKCVLLNKCIIM